MKFVNPTLFLFACALRKATGASVIGPSTASALLSSASELAWISLNSAHSSSVAKAVSTQADTSTKLSATTATPTLKASSTTAQPTVSAVDPSTLADISLVHERRLSSIIGELGSPANIPAWLSSLGSNGKWPDSEVDYTTGCTAQRANWPAQSHWQRILIMAGAWHGGLSGAAQYVQDPTIRASISLAMDYWFSRDFTNVACLDSGGTASCPCTNLDNSLWNTNWFSNIILIPELVGQTCLLLNDTLLPPQVASCTRMTGRSYATFDHNINGVGFLTGANTLDVAKIGIDQALLTVNASMLTDAYRRVHLELSIKDTVKADGIRADGSFGQHGGILYNGNYGKDYSNDILDIEIEAGGTQFSATQDSQDAFATLYDGNSWMIYRNVLTGILHWDFSVLGRFVSFPVIDNQATGSIKTNLTQVGVLGQQWKSASLSNFASSLQQNTTHANAGNLRGNRMFYANDYMVHRGANYVSTVKMYSSRTQNTECTNSQNPFGFHLADGVLHTYITGNEYEDISAAWDWNLIPGITVDYGATTLACQSTQFTGIEGFVGGVSTGQTGIAVMRFTNPLTKSLRWQKAWFFLKDDVQHVMIANVSSATNAPIYSVLDQRLHVGPVFVDEVEQSASVNHISAQSIWHADVGYTFSNPSGSSALNIQVGNVKGNWSAIGISQQPPPTVNLFSARLEHSAPLVPLAYTIFPGASRETFRAKRANLHLKTIQNDAHISACYDEDHRSVMIVFWDRVGGTVTIPALPGVASIIITAKSQAAMIYDIDTASFSVSDPSQTQTAVTISWLIGEGLAPPSWGATRNKTMTIQLPQGGNAGQTVTQSL